MTAVDQRGHGGPADPGGAVPGGGTAQGPISGPAAALPRPGVTYGYPDPATDVTLADAAIPAPGPVPGRGRAQKTRRAYSRRARQLIKRNLKELGGTADTVTTTALVGWLIAQKPSWVPNAWRQNKAALCYAYERSIESLTARREGEADPDAAARISARLAAISLTLEGLRAEGSSGCAAETAKTSANKLKALPEADRRAITAALARIRSRYAEALDDFLLAGVRTGLRPVEWAGTSRLPDDGDGALVLRVPNAKHDAVRGHGPYRTLTFTGLPAEERVVILRWLDRVRAAGDGVDGLLIALGDLLYVITRRVWPRRRRRPALYSTRHQFASMAKLRYDAAEVAALLGHASDETATRHYGRRRADRGLPPELRAVIDRLPRPDPDEVRRIRPRIAAARGRLAAMRDRKEAGAAPQAMR